MSFARPRRIPVFVFALLAVTLFTTGPGIDRATAEEPSGDLRADALAVDFPGSAGLTTPTPASTFAGPIVHFAWNPNGTTQPWGVQVGSTEGGQEYAGFNTTEPQADVVVPTDGSTVHVRLWSFVDIWRFNDYTFTAALRATMVDPVAGSALPGSTYNFQWNTHHADFGFYGLQVGSTPGGFDIFNGNPGVPSQIVNGIPVDGRTIYVRLWSRFIWNNNTPGDATDDMVVWQFADTTYTAHLPVRAFMTTPAAEFSSLTGTTFTFIWNPGTHAGGVYGLQVGTTGVGSFDLFNGNPPANSQVVTGLPFNGASIYVRLWSFVGGIWNFNDYRYFAFLANPASIAAPANGSTLGGSVQTFTINAQGSTIPFTILVGSAPGLSNYATATLTTPAGGPLVVNGLPQDGRQLFVRLLSQAGGTTVWRDYVFTAANAMAAFMTSPGPGSQLQGSTVKFQWNRATTTAPFGLQIGTGQGLGNIHTSTQYGEWAWIYGLPVGGGSIWARLWSVAGGFWQFKDYEYKPATAPIRAYMLVPESNHALEGPAQWFQWDWGTSALNYIDVGTTLGASDVTSTTPATTTGAFVNNIPTNGPSQLYVRLWSSISGAWEFYDYQYAQGVANAHSMVSPTPGTTLSGAAVMFTYSAPVVNLFISDCQGCAGMAGPPPTIVCPFGSNTCTVTGLPTDGRTLWVRVYSNVPGAGIPQFKDFVYTAFHAGPSPLGIGPANNPAPTPPPFPEAPRLPELKDPPPMPWLNGPTLSVREN